MALYVSGHGYGHAVRSAEVAREILARGARVLLRTEAPRWLFPDAVEVLSAPGEPLDVGVAQRDGLTMDFDRTHREWDHLADCFEQRVEQEAALLRTAGAVVLVGDMPPLAFAAARRAGIPGAAVTNFGWDWIYAAWPGFDRAVACVRAGYHQADVLLRLPLHSTDPEAFPAFRHVEDVPLIARKAERPADVLRASLGLPPVGRLVLLSFGGYDASDLDLGRLGCWPEYTFVVTPGASVRQADLPANVVVLPREQTDYVSLLGACDAVVTKPGYGIVADCLANQVPLLYTDRGPFREYEVLVRILEEDARALFAPRDALLRGDIGSHLDALFAQTRPWRPVACDGAAVVAERVLRLARD